MASSNRSTNAGRSRTSSSEAMKLRQAQMLLSVSHTVAALETVDEVIETMVEIVTRETNATRGTLNAIENLLQSEVDQEIKLQAG